MNIHRNLVLAFCSSSFIGRAKLSYLVDFILLDDAEQEAAIRAWAAAAALPALEAELAAHHADCENCEARIGALRDLGV